MNKEPNGLCIVLFIGLIMAGGARKLLDELGARNVQIADLEKRLAEEKEIARIRLSVMDDLEQKLKTAEDALADCRECLSKELGR